MKTIKIFTIGLLIAGTTIFTSCEKDGCTDVNANNFNADNDTCTYPIINTSSTGKSGDISGAGGTASRTFTFTNSNNTAGWDMSIDASSGSFQLVLKDASGTTVLDRTLTARSGSQDADGRTASGTVGTWTATITLTKFTGSGDYSFL